MNWLQPALLKLQVDLLHFGLRWALIGGMAVSLRSEPRTTKDLDVAIAVTGNPQAESIVRDFTSRGYRLDAVREHVELSCLASVGLVTTVPEARGIAVDLMFASSGIEKEVVVASDRLEVLSGVAVPVATTAHLLALKTLAGRPKDIVDFITLMRHARGRDLLEAREALEVITRRGYHRDKDLQVEFSLLLDLSRQEA